MAVNFTLGFEDEYSDGFDKLTDEMEKQEKATDDLKKATDEHNESLKRMAEEHEDTARAMLKTREASGSASGTLSNAGRSFADVATKGKDASLSASDVAESMGKLALRGAKVYAVLKAVKFGYDSITSGDSGGLLNEHIKETIKNLNPFSEAWKDATERIRLSNERMRVARDEMFGISKASRELSEELQKQSPHWKNLRESMGGIEEIRQAELDMRELRKITRKQDIEEQLKAERQRHSSLVTSEKKNEEAIAQSQKRILDLKLRGYEIEDERMEENRRKWQRLQDEEKQYRIDLARFREKQRQEEIAADRDAEEQRIKAKAEAAKKAEELAEQEFQNMMANERKKIQAAKEAANIAYEIERAKIEKIKSLTDDQGKNLFEHQMDKQGPQAVEAEINRRRIAESKAERPNRGAEAQRRTERGIRAQTARDLQSGKIKPEEIQKIQSQLASAEILAANKAGKVSQEMLKTLAGQVKEFTEQAKFNEEVSRQLIEIGIAAQQSAEGKAKQTERVRAQRRGVRR